MAHNVARGIIHSHKQFGGKEKAQNKAQSVRVLIMLLPGEEAPPGGKTAPGRGGTVAEERLFI